MSTSEDITPTPSRNVKPTTHSKMEMGSDIFGLYYMIAKNKMTT